MSLSMQCFLQLSLRHHLQQSWHPACTCTDFWSSVSIPLGLSRVILPYVYNVEVGKSGREARAFIWDCLLSAMLLIVRRFHPAQQPQNLFFDRPVQRLSLHMQ